jgi:Cu-Zn family superoxide dismutase
VRHIVHLAAALALSGAPALALAADPAPAAPSPAASITIDLRDAAGATVGTGVLTEAPHGVILRLTVQGLTPGWHGLHFHEKGVCAAPDFKSAGGHVHGMGAAMHGLLNPSATETGDLPNLHVGADGAGATEVYSTLVSLKGAEGRPALTDADGSAIVIHANPDDHLSQPIGGAGARVACGIIAAG